MRAFDYFMLVGGLVMIIGAAYGAARGKKDVVEVTALALVGLGVTILGVDKVSATIIPAGLEILASLLLVVGGLLFLGLKHERKTS